MDIVKKVINTGTTRNDLLNICKDLKLPFFKGIYPCDLIPNLDTLGKTFCIIVNTHPSTLWGEHWILLFRHNKKSLKISDSLNLPKNFFESQLGVVIKQYKATPLRPNKIQDNQSWNCGLFVLHDLFLFHLKTNPKTRTKTNQIIWNYRNRASYINDKICICNISKMITFIQ